MNYLQYKNKLKHTTCLQHHEALLLIKTLGHGLMSKTHFYKHYYRLYGFSENTCRKILQDLLQTEIIEIINYQGLHIIKLKKFAIRYLKQEELNKPVENHDISSIKVTDSKIKRIIFINQLALYLTKSTTIQCDDMHSYINLLKECTPFFYTKTDTLTYYHNASIFLKKDTFDLSTIFKTEISRLEHSRYTQAHFLITHEQNNTITTNTYYDLNNMLNSNIFLLIKNTTLTVVIGDPFKIYTSYNIAPLLLKINTYLYNLLEVNGYIPFLLKFVFVSTSVVHQSNLENHLDYAYKKIRADASNIYSFPYKREDFKVISI